MQVAFYLVGEITQVNESIPWVRCASGNVLYVDSKICLTHTVVQEITQVYGLNFWVRCASGNVLYFVT